MLLIREIGVLQLRIGCLYPILLMGLQPSHFQSPIKLWGLVVLYSPISKSPLNGNYHSQLSTCRSTPLLWQTYSPTPPCTFLCDVEQAPTRKQDFPNNQSAGSIENDLSHDLECLFFIHFIHVYKSHCRKYRTNMHVYATLVYIFICIFVGSSGTR